MEDFTIKVTDITFVLSAIVASCAYYNALGRALPSIPATLVGTFLAGLTSIFLPDNLWRPCIALVCAYGLAKWKCWLELKWRDFAESSHSRGVKAVVWTSDLVLAPFPAPKTWWFTWQRSPNRHHSIRIKGEPEELRGVIKEWPTESDDHYRVRIDSHDKDQYLTGDETLIPSASVVWIAEIPPRTTLTQEEKDEKMDASRPSGLGPGAGARRGRADEGQTNRTREDRRISRMKWAATSGVIGLVASVVAVPVLLRCGNRGGTRTWRARGVVDGRAAGLDSRWPCGALGLGPSPSPEAGTEGVPVETPNKDDQ